MATKSSIKDVKHRKKAGTFILGMSAAASLTKDDSGKNIIEDANISLSPLSSPVKFVACSLPLLQALSGANSPVSPNEGFPDDDVNKFEEGSIKPTLTDVTDATVAMPCILPGPTETKKLAVA